MWKLSTPIRDPLVFLNLFQDYKDREKDILYLPQKKMQAAKDLSKLLQGKIPG